jgi:hypothetical protein
MPEKYKCEDCPIPSAEEKLCLFALVAKLSYTRNYWIDGMKDDEVYEGEYEPVCPADLFGREVEVELVETLIGLGLPYDSSDVYETLSLFGKDTDLESKVIDCINKKLSSACSLPRI